jgi:o-succinylbenzoate synthase
MKASFQKRLFNFKNPAGTSRGILLTKPSWYIYFYNEEDPTFKGIGECSIIPGLSLDKEDKIEDTLAEICKKINSNDYNFKNTIPDFPAIQFALEAAYLDYNAKGSKILFPSSFTSGEDGIPINGLIWMGSLSSMQEQIENKLDNNYRCIKIKIGALDFNDEFNLLKKLRNRFSANDLEIRVDANGAYRPREALEYMGKLADLKIHSIEQPIIPAQIYEMADLCRKTPLPIALDEELFGITPVENKRKLIEIIKPQYLVLKPSMLGGLNETLQWINIAKSFDIGWWVTSALESNIGLSAIAQWTYDQNISIPQGLGTGNLFEKNVISPLTLNGEKLFYDPAKEWNFEFVY